MLKSTASTARRAFVGAEVLRPFSPPNRSSAQLPSFRYAALRAAGSPRIPVVPFQPHRSRGSGKQDGVLFPVHFHQGRENP